MKITPILNNIYKLPTFSSTSRTIYQHENGDTFELSYMSQDVIDSVNQNLDTDVKVKVSNQTRFFREDIPWNRIGRVFKKQFPKGKVNVYDFACSDGSEAYSLAISLIEQLGERKAQRFFPIIASDVDPFVINKAKSNFVFATSIDMTRIDDMINMRGPEKYFHVTKLSPFAYELRPKPILTNAVVFEPKGINEGLDDVKKGENNIIVCRNFWKYLSKEELSDASWKLGEKLDDKTLVLFGGFDFHKGKKTPFFARAHGMTQIDSAEWAKNIFTRKKELPKEQAIQNKAEWDLLVDREYDSYIPKYIVS